MGRLQDDGRAEWRNKPKPSRVVIGQDMPIRLDLPDDLGATLNIQGKTCLGRPWKLEEYGAETLTTAQVRRLLGLQTRMQVHAPS